jgi:hypothetical protein
MTRCLVLLFGFLAWSVLRGDVSSAQDKLEAPGARYQGLVKDFEKAQAAFVQRLQTAASVEAQAKLFREDNPQATFATRFLELARKHPKDPAAYASLAWVVHNSDLGPATARTFAQAIDRLAAEHVGDDRLEELFGRLATSPFKTAARLLQAALEKSPRAASRGRAGFTLALHWKHFAETVDDLAHSREKAKAVEAFLGRELYQEIVTTDTASVRLDMERVLERVRKDFAFVKHNRTTLGKAAEAELYELRNLSIGKTAPDIEGEDTDGKRFKLSDYRGKVVALVFWGNW